MSEKMPEESAVPDAPEEEEASEQSTSKDPSMLGRASERAAEAFTQPSADPRAIKLGRLSDFIGEALFPLGLGAVGGFYAADQGVRWVPTMLGIVAFICVVSLLAMAVGRWLAGTAVTETERGLRLRKRVIAAVALALVALTIQIVMVVAKQPSPLTELSRDEFSAAFVIDTKQYAEHNRGMELILDRIETAGFLNAPSTTVLDPEHESLLRESWSALRNYAIALDQTRMFYEDYWRFDASRAERDLHLRSYLLAYASELALHEKAIRFTALVENNPNAKKFLNTPHEGYSLPADSFSQFRQDLLGARDQSRVIAGERYLQWLDKGLRCRPEAKALGIAWLWDNIDEHLEVIKDVSSVKRTVDTVRADTQGLKRGVRRVWYPAQKEVAQWAGDTRVRRIGWYLIDRTLQEQMDPSLEPGDIMLSRKNWYLSNVGLPGFWPHGLLYIGDSKKFTAYFDDPSVNAWVSAQAGTAMTFSQYLSLRWPSRWRAYTLGQGGEANRVIEAISEGVVFNTMNHAAGDYLVALRPRLSKLDKARAILYAFRQIGLPYDFDFDFATDHALVCTELVWRAYRAEGDKGGLEIPLIKVAGRQTLPANELARLFSEQHGKPGAQLDFVYFIDAEEKKRKPFVSDEAAFLTTWERPQWDTAQK